MGEVPLYTPDVCDPKCFQFDVHELVQTLQPEKIIVSRFGGQVLPPVGWLKTWQSPNFGGWKLQVAIPYGNTCSLSTWCNEIYYTERSFSVTSKQTCSNYDWNQVYELQVFRGEIAGARALWPRPHLFLYLSHTQHTNA